MRRLRRYIDRQWIKQHWCGSQSLKLRVIAYTPLLLSVAIGGLLGSYAIQISAVVLGFLATVILAFWIEFRRQVGTGAFSSIRSERFVRRQRARAEKPEPD